jgi:hypothetical protein
VEAVHVAPLFVENHTEDVSAVAHTIEEPSGAMATVPPPFVVPVGTAAKAVQVRPPSVEVTPSGVAP